MKMYLRQYIFFLSIIGLTAALTLNSRHKFHSLTNPQTIHEFSNPTWIENLAVRPNGQILVNLVTTPSVYLLNPYPNSTATLLHNFTSAFAVLGITETKPDIFHTIVSNFTLPFNIAQGTDSIWTLDLTSYDCETNTGAQVHEVTLIPEAGLLNGLSTLSAERGLIVAADSLNGYLWLIDINTATYSILLQGPELSNPFNTSALGINGVRVLPACSLSSSSFADTDTVYIYFDNQATSSFLRIPFSLSTLKATGPYETLATNITADDFVLDPDTGFAYLAVPGSNSISRVPLKGGVPEFVFGGTNSTRIPNPSSVVLSRGKVKEGEGEGEGGGRIYVCTTGGLEGPVNGTYVEGGKVVSYDLGG